MASFRRSPFFQLFLNFVVWQARQFYAGYIFVISSGFHNFTALILILRTIMKSSNGVASTADRLKQWKSEKSSAATKSMKQQPGTSRGTIPGGSSSSNGNNLKTSKSGGLGTSTAGLRPKSGNVVPAVAASADMAAVIAEDIVDDVDGEYDVAYLQTILKQMLLLRYRMFVQHSKEKQLAGRT